MTKTENHFVISLDLGYVHIVITPKKSLYILMTEIIVCTEDII